MKILQIKFFIFILFFLFPNISFAEKTVVIDPGHGGAFRGTCGYSGLDDGFCEKDANLLVSLKLKEVLEETSDITVHMTRTTDTDFLTEENIANGETTEAVDLYNRMTIANGFVEGNNDNSIFISIHFNQDINSSNTGGTETYYYDGINHFKPEFLPNPKQLELLNENRRLGEIAHTNLLSYLGLRDRELRNDQSFNVIRNAEMPAILVEIAFMTNLEQERLTKSEDFQWEAAQALADAAIAYFQVYEIFDENHNRIETFTEKEKAIAYAEEHSQLTVFDKYRQEVIYPEPEPIAVDMRRLFYNPMFWKEELNSKYVTLFRKFLHMRFS
ncbi:MULTISPECIES: N-acetylmuramoyl-L-alanine amidase family protein [Bacillaceae]|uniref:N-acetylmuramoyl-L-alanine amidase n=1 Tax=Evansella alkalicola TaxID=745819 RepID=A0ABS6JSJ2_9BACI|nr:MULTISPECIES: N-acetylmuramoyl-L-alanine amidase [Bacillaceae]MBU9721539.1 N-acetylmuramoyl-L-alanine amidase [Bacillus alkalicola]